MMGLDSFVSTRLRRAEEWLEDWTREAGCILEDEACMTRLGGWGWHGSRRGLYR